MQVQYKPVNNYMVYLFRSFEKYEEIYRNIQQENHVLKNLKQKSLFESLNY